MSQRHEEYQVAFADVPETLLEQALGKSIDLITLHYRAFQAKHPDEAKGLYELDMQFVGRWDSDEQCYDYHLHAVNLWDHFDPETQRWSFKDVTELFLSLNGDTTPIYIEALNAFTERELLATAQGKGE